jgi:hypothetical protein
MLIFGREKGFKTAVSEPSAKAQPFKRLSHWFAPKWAKIKVYSLTSSLY